MEQVTYGIWAESYGNRVDTYSEATAREYYAEGRKFDAMFGDPDAPRVVINFASARMLTTVWFLDEHQRPTTEYVFGSLRKGETWDIPKPGIGRIMLETVTTIEYLNVKKLPEDSKANALELKFKPDGTVTVWGQTDGELYEGETHLPDDIRDTILYEPYPVFGDWASLIREDRDLGLNNQALGPT